MNGFDIDTVLPLMAEMVKAEFVTHYAYKVYAETLRDLSHDSIAEHFEEHAGDEMEHAGFLLRRMTVIGGSGVDVPAAEAPPADTDPSRIIEHMIELERKGIDNWKRLRDAVGDDPMYVTVEEYMVKEQEHFDDLMQLMPIAVNPVAEAFMVPSVAARVAESLVSKVVKTPDKDEWCVRSESNPDWSGGCYVQAHEGRVKRH